MKIFQMKEIFNYKGGKIYYYDKGKGDVIVLLHGYLESAEVWNGFEEKLSAGYRTISIDMPGHGQSDIYGDTHTMEFMATVIKELISGLGIGKIFLTGHSLGGYVALAFIELFPDFLTGYSLFHSHPFADSPEAEAKRLREIEIVKAGRKELIYPENVLKMFAPSNVEKFAMELERSKKIASMIPGDGIIAVLRGMMDRPSRLSVMEMGRVPCLWILGSMDNYIPCDIILPQVKLPSNAEVVILNKTGHLGFIEEEDLSVSVLTDFVEKLKS
jgi:pimeloyl-ACP methyl ester carboxylesterase